MKFEIVVAIDANGGIGLKGDLPWRLPGDLKYFKKITTETSSANSQNAVIMGRTTWESIPEKFRPLPNRVNIVLSSKKDWGSQGAHHAISLDQALEIANELNCERLFVIGGGNVYQQTILHPQCNRLFITQIQQSFECDTFFPKIPSLFQLKQESETQVEKEIQYHFQIFEKS